MCFISQTTSVQPVGNSLVHFSLRKVTATSIHNVENRLLHGLVDISAYYVQWLRITTCFIYTEWCWGVIYTLLDAISLVINPFCPRSHSMYCNCSFLILVFLVCTQYDLFSYRRDYCACADWDAAACRCVYSCAVHFPSVSLDMRKELVQYDSRMGYWKGKGESKRFVPLTNFAMKFIKFVHSPEQLPDYAGFWLWRWRNPVGRELQKGQCQCTVFTDARYLHYCPW